MRELLNSILDVVRLAGPLNTVLFLLGLGFVILVLSGIRNQVKDLRMPPR